MNAYHPQKCLQGPLEHDAELFQIAKEGVKEAALLLFGRHADGFRVIVRGILASRLRSMLDPDDVLQEVAVILLSRPLPDWLSTSVDFTRYVGGIAKNIALVHNRKYLDGRHHSLYREVPLASVRENDTPRSPEPSSSDLTQDKEALADLQDWLPLRVREIVAWVCAGYSVAEVALLLDIDQETVIMFVCTANNYGPHPERKISNDEALRLFKPRSRPRRKKSIA